MHHRLVIAGAQGKPSTFQAHQPSTTAGNNVVATGGNTGDNIISARPKGLLHMASSRRGPSALNIHLLVKDQLQFVLQRGATKRAKEHSH
jgi:hypothetical protein